MKIHHVLLLLALLSALSACERKVPPTEPGKPVASQGRAETKAIRNTEAIGVSGNAIADKVDTLLNQNDALIKAQAQQLESKGE
jgi:predicted small lipoprotein YifL